MKHRIAGLLVVALALFAAPSVANGALLYDQTDAAGVPNADPSALNFSPSNEFTPTDYDRTADDFTVPEGETWTLTEVDVFGAYADAPGSPNPEVNAFIFADAGGQPGAELFRQSGIPVTGGPDYTVPLAAAPPLSPGTYWISVQQRVGDGPYWSWTTRTVQSGSPAHWFSVLAEGEPACDPGTWNPRQTCWPGPNPDQVFRLLGDDGVAPKTTFLKRPRNKLDKPKAKYRFVASETPSTFECKLDRKKWKACSSPAKLKGLDEGKHKFKVRATDEDGATGRPAKDKFKVVG